MSHVVNLGLETAQALAKLNYTIEDIDWIGTRIFTVPIHEFFDVACRTNYNNSYGTAKIPRDLIIKMKDGSWYSRGEYDGSEWWRHNLAPTKPTIQHHLKVSEFLEIDYEWEPTLIEACEI